MIIRRWWWWLGPLPPVKYHQLATANPSRKLCICIFIVKNHKSWTIRWIISTALCWSTHIHGSWILHGLETVLYNWGHFRYTDIERIRFNTIPDLYFVPSVCRVKWGFWCTLCYCFFAQQFIPPNSNNNRPHSISLSTRSGCDVIHPRAITRARNWFSVSPSILFLIKGTWLFNSIKGCCGITNQD